MSRKAVLFIARSKPVRRKLSTKFGGHVPCDIRFAVRHSFVSHVFSHPSFCVFRHFLKITKSDYWLLHVCLSVCLSVLQSASNSAAPTGRILMKFDILGFFENQLREPKIWSKCHKNNRYCTWRPIYSCDNISLSTCQKEKCLEQKLWRKSKHVFCFWCSCDRAYLIWNDVWDQLDATIMIY